MAKIERCLMSLSKTLKIAIAIGLVLMVAAVIWEGTTRYKLDKQIQIEKEEQLLRENARLRYIQQLSVEFSFDPRIVMTVDHLAGEYIKQGDLAYRLLTRELFTYLFLSLIFAESEGDSTAIGDDGKAYGLTQLWLTSAKQYNENVTETELLTVQGNLTIAFQHADYLLKKYRGNVALWLYSWNRGEGTVDSLLNYGGVVENGYARRVYEAAELNNRRMDWR